MNVEKQPTGAVPASEMKPENIPFGDRPLSVFEKADMLICGLTREQIANMTPESLEQLSDHVVETSYILLGS
jgi:hypothetical protein